MIILSCKFQTKNASLENDWALIPFQKADSLNPIFSADTSLKFNCPIAQTNIKWAEKDVFNPAATLRNDTVFLLFRAEDVVGQYNGTSRVGLAWSTDGYHFTSYPSPVLYPDNDEYKSIEWEGGCEDPRITESEVGTYILTYTSYDGTTARLMIASSTDLMNWKKHGPAFTGSLNDKYSNIWNKSGSIVSDYRSGKPVAKKINGKYWMYWGDQNIWAATSDDLIKWTPVHYEAGDTPFEDPRGIAKELTDLKTVLGPRKKKFDSDLIEPGPPAMYTDKGIVLIYNSRNIPEIGDKELAEGTYAAGQVLLDKNDPLKVLARLDDYFMKPEKDYEIAGQVNQVCFLEGLVKYKGRWFVYYGTADSKIAVATSSAK
ncbi:MAG: glycoside hydrolase family 130 protein [Bacteroidota bacterium]|nr:glycoside hydrolase family 130 protein [Bacteroidota bacterium]